MKRLLALVMLASLITAIYYDYHEWRLRQAYRIFSAGDLTGALSVWSSIKRLPGQKDIARFNSGVAAYRMGNYSAALNDFRAVAAGNDRSFHGKAFYNLGTTFIRIAAEQSSESPAAAEHYLNEAVKNLRETLALTPSDEPAMFNLKAAQMRLSTILNGKDIKNQGESSVSSTQQKPSESGEKKRNEPKEPEKGAAKPGKATDMDQEGAQRRPAAMDRNEALRMLDEVRGRESLRTATPYSKVEKGPAPPEKDW